MKTKIAITIATMIFAAGSSFAADAKTSKADRQKMVEMHTKMATCLKSDKSMNECRKEMMGDQQGMRMMMESSGCSMMEDGQMKGMMKGQGMMGHGNEDSKKGNE